MKQVELSEAETANDAKIFCTLTGTCEGYGTVAVDDTLMVTHTRGAADANDTLSIVDGNLVANSDNVYVLDGNVLRAEYPRLNDTVTATAYMGNAAPSETVEFKYNTSGLRVQKTVTQDNEKTITDYFYHGKIVVGMAVSHTEGEEVIQDESLHFYYDAQSIPAKIKFNNEFYTYIYNAQGDIVGILDSNGSIVVEYKYNAWGRLLSTTGNKAATLGKLNPFRYRGYVYDEETGLYYVSNRHYDPEIGRWINADDTAYLGSDDTLLSYNLFTYCVNNPKNRIDKSGNWSVWATVGIFVGAALCIAAATVLTCGVGTATLMGSIAVGAAKGTVIGATVGTTVGAGIGYATTRTLEGAATGAAIGLGAGAVIGAAVGSSVGSNSWYNARALEFTNYGSNEVVLGRSGTYEQVAQARGSTYFYTSDARWIEVQDMFGVGSKGTWKINQVFLDQQIAAGRSFVLSNDPIMDGGGCFAKEVAYLVKKGITYSIIYVY